MKLPSTARREFKKSEREREMLAQRLRLTDNRSKMGTEIKDK